MVVSAGFLYLIQIIQCVVGVCIFPEMRISKYWSIESVRER